MSSTPGSRGPPQRTDPDGKATNPNRHMSIAAPRLPIAEYGLCVGGNHLRIPRTVAIVSLRYRDDFTSGRTEVASPRWFIVRASTVIVICDP